MILNNGNFTSARFVNNNRDTIMATWVDDATQQAQEIIIPVEVGNYIYHKLLEKFSIDEINEMTNQFIAEYRALFNTKVKEIAEKNGLIVNPTIDGNISDSFLLDSIFSPPADEEKKVELLFETKLKLFELPEILNSTNVDLKKKLREASTPLESFYWAGKILFE